MSEKTLVPLLYADGTAVKGPSGGVKVEVIAGGGGGPVTIADGADVAQGTTTDLATASTVIGLLKNLKAALAGKLLVTADPITFAAPQHVIVDTAPSTAVTGPLTDTQLRASAPHVIVDTAPSTAVTQGTSPWVTNDPGLPDTLGQKAMAGSTGVVIASDQASIPVAATLSAETTKGIGVVRVSDGTNTSAVKAASALAAATDPALVVQLAPQNAQASVLAVTVTAATGVAATLTIPAAAAGLFHYITYLEISLYATVARVGGATPVLVTTTNLPGSPVYDFDTAQAIGVMIRTQIPFPNPLKSSVAATATTFVAPIAVTGIWRITAYYYAAP